MKITAANSEKAGIDAAKTARRLAITQEPVVRFEEAESEHILEFSESDKQTKLVIWELPNKFWETEISLNYI